jgi:hypothetical protein
MSLLAPRALPTDYWACVRGPCSSKVACIHASRVPSLQTSPVIHPTCSTPRIHIHVAHVSAVPVLHSTHSTPLHGTACCRSQAGVVMGYISGNASTQGNLFATALCLTASHPSPPTAFLCLLLLVYCKPPFNILSHVVRLAPGLRSFSVFLLPPSRPPSLPPSLPLTPPSLPSLASL